MVRNAAATRTLDGARCPRRWRAHADALATLRTGGGAVWGGAGVLDALSARLARGLRGALYDGARQDGLDLARGVATPAQLARGADASTYAHELVDSGATKLLLAAGVAALALRCVAAVDAPPVEVAKQALVAAAAGLGLTYAPGLADGSLFAKLAAARRFDDA